jgi:hypothetical protein
VKSALRAFAAALFAAWFLPVAAQSLEAPVLLAARPEGLWEQLVLRWQRHSQSI